MAVDTAVILSGQGRCDAYPGNNAIPDPELMHVYIVLRFDLAGGQTDQEDHPQSSAGYPVFSPHF